MSKAKTPAKVLKVALRRVQTRWTKGAWASKQQDGSYAVCMEGAIFGFCNKPHTAAQVEALQILTEVIREDISGNQQFAEAEEEQWGFVHTERLTVPQVNDLEITTQEDVERWMKKALIRAETGGSLDEDPDFTDEEIDELLDKELLDD